MKLLDQTPKCVVRVLIRKQKSKSTVLSFQDTTADKAIAEIKAMLRPHVDPFAVGLGTSITVWEECDGEKSTAQSFKIYNMEVAEVKSILLEPSISIPSEQTTE